MDAFRRETEHLNAERIPQAATFFLCFVGATLPLEYLFFPKHIRLWLLFYALEAAICLPLVGARWLLVRRGWLLPANVAVWSALSLLVHGYGAAVGVPAELLGVGAVCLMTGASMLLPWGPRAQSLLCGATLLAYAGAISLGIPWSIHPLYLLLPTGAGAFLSVAGARYLDLHRLAIFREATLREAEAEVSGTLVAIAKEINGSLDADDVLERITGAIRAAVGCSWSAIMLRDERRDVFRLVATSGPVPAALRELEGIDFGAGAFPLVERVIAEHYVEIGQLSADAPTASFMRHWECHLLRAARLSRGGEAVGILVAGTRGGDGQVDAATRQLFRGISEHAAIALNNVRLIKDLRQADQLKSDFLSTMSHELRTPLNVIIGYSDLLLDGAFGDVQNEQQQVLTRVSENAHSLLELISATLEVNRIEAGRARLQLREVSLRRLVNELQHETGHLPHHPGVGVSWEGPAQDVKLRTDPSKLKIIVKNLVGNALKFTERGRVVVRVAYDRRAAQVTVQVNDTGMGIASEDLPHIFAMFRQGEGRNQFGGVGLGLYIVKRFAEQLGGKVGVRSILGEGSTFHLSLPVSSAAEGDATEAAPQTEMVA